MGKFAAANAVGYLRALLSATQEQPAGNTVAQVWLNVGIAGHKTLDLGTALLAHKVRDAAGMNNYYPCFTFNLPCLSSEVISVEHAETDYAADAAYDMEALGFCAATSRFSSFELIHCLKIISDNQSTPHQHVTKHVGEELVGNQLLVIENLIDEFNNLFANLHLTASIKQVLSEDFEFLTGRFRFTVSQKNQLKRLLQRWHVLESAPVFQHLSLQDFSSAKQVLSGIELHLQSKTYRC
jgi:hypothetical protein